LNEKTVLIVDDDNDLRDSVSDAFHQSNRNMSW